MTATLYEQQLKVGEDSLCLYPVPYFVLWLVYGLIQYRREEVGNPIWFHIQVTFSNSVLMLSISPVSTSQLV